VVSKAGKLSGNGVQGLGVVVAYLVAEARE